MTTLIRHWIAAVTLVCLALAPLVVALTHGPASAPAAEQAMPDGHSHDHADGHTHDDTDPRTGHDATDHEHQLSAVLPGDTGTAIRLAGQHGLITGWPGMPPRAEGLRRPPRV